MLVVLQDGGSYQGVMANTAYRGCACFMYGRDASGQLKFRTPKSSVEGAKSCYIVDWENLDYTNVIGSSTSSAMDYTTGNKKATFHYGGWYRTNKYRSAPTHTIVGRYTRTTDTAFYTLYSSGANEVAYICATNATYQGYIQASSMGSGLSAVASRLHNVNFYITNIDAGSAAPYGRGPWVEFRSIKSRIDAGYLLYATSTMERITH